MPAIYAHNKFGKKVIASLPSKQKQLISRNKNAFRLGLQGPDTLFFYRPVCKNKVNQTGVKLHKLDAYPFFEDAATLIINGISNEAGHAYILGCICHFALDNMCHPYVLNSMETTHCGHVEIEGDFDRYLLEMDGYNPASYRLDKLIPRNPNLAIDIEMFYPSLSLKEICSAILGFRITKRLLIAPSPVKSAVIDAMMHINYKFFKGHMIVNKANPECIDCSKHLYELMLLAVPEATSRIVAFENTLTSGKPLPDSFHGNYYGSNRIGE